MSQIQEVIDDLIELEPRTQAYIEENLESLVEESFVEETRSVAQAMNLPLEFIDGIWFKIMGPLHFKIINTWGTAKKPLALWFNDGTADHWIEPSKEGGVLVWEATFGRNAPAIFFAGNVEEGTLLYSKGHMVSGLPKTEAMQNGIRLGMVKFKSLVLKNTSPNVSKELENIE